MGKQLQEKLRLEKFAKARALGRQENKKIAQERSRKEVAVEQKVLALSQNVANKLNSTSDTSQVAIEPGKRDWLASELRLQQQDGLIFLDKQKLKTFEDVRCCDLKMFKQAEIESFQNDGRISRKLYNRLTAARTAIANNFKQETSNYILNAYAYKHAPQHGCDIIQLEQFNGNGIQHNIHGEVVGLVNRYSYYLHANTGGVVGDGTSLYEAANIVLGMKDKLDGQDSSAKTKIYERTYSFLDFCHNLLKVKVGKSALYLIQRFGMGLEQAGDDIQEVFKNGLRGCFQEEAFDDDHLMNILDGKGNSQETLEKLQASFENARKKFGVSVSNLFHTIKKQPLKETVGDAIQFLSRKLGQASAIIAATLGIIVAAEAGVAVATSAAGVIAAKKLLEPVVLDITADGAAVLGQATSSGASVCQEVVTVLGQAAQGLHGVLDIANNACCAMRGRWTQGLA